MRVARRLREHTLERSLLAALRQHVRFEEQAIAIRKAAGLAQHHGRLVHQFGIDGGRDRRVLHRRDHTWRVFQIAPIRREQVVDVDHHGLALDDSVSCRGALIVHVAFATLSLGRRHRFRSRFCPMLQIEILILQCVGEFVGEDRTLLLHGDGIQEPDHLGLIIVEAGDRLPIRLHQELAQVEVARQQAELFHGEFGAREALRKIRSRQPVFRELFNVRLADDVLLDDTALGEPCILARELEHLIDGLEEFLGVHVGHLDLGGLVLAKLARHVRQTLRFRRGCTRWRPRRRSWLLTNGPGWNKKEKRKECKQARSREHSLTPCREVLRNCPGNLTRIELQTAVRDYRSNRKDGSHFSGSIAVLSRLRGTFCSTLRVLCDRSPRPLRFKVCRMPHRTLPSLFILSRAPRCYTAGYDFRIRHS